MVTAQVLYVIPSCMISHSSNAAYAAADLAGVNRKEYSPQIRFEQIPSIHIVNADLVNRARENGASGIMLIQGSTDKKTHRESKKPVQCHEEGDQIA